MGTNKNCIFTAEWSASIYLVYRTYADARYSFLSSLSYMPSKHPAGQPLQFAASESLSSHSGVFRQLRICSLPSPVALCHQLKTFPHFGHLFMSLIIIPFYMPCINSLYFSSSQGENSSVTFRDLKVYNSIVCLPFLFPVSKE